MSADLTAPDPLTAELEAIEQRSVRPLGPSAGALPISDEATRRLMESAADVPRLLALAKAVLERHQGQLDHDYPQEGRFCAPCGEWSPCEEYQIITEALLGKDGTE